MSDAINWNEKLEIPSTYCPIPGNSQATINASPIQVSVDPNDPMEINDKELLELSIPDPNPPFPASTKQNPSQFLLTWGMHTTQVNHCSPGKSNF
jgi:hypothetical protein